MRRLNWGCGNDIRPDWTNADLKDLPGIDLVGDIRDGLALEDDAMDYVVSIHALPMISYPDLVPVLRELKRVLRPGGVLRLSLPDVDKGIDAYRRGDASHFFVPDEDARSLGGKFVVHMLWYGWSVTLFTADFAQELLERAGYRDVRLCGYQETASDLEGITDLDNREHESLFIEGVK